MVRRAHSDAKSLTNTESSSPHTARRFPLLSAKVCPVRDPEPWRLPLVRLWRPRILVVLVLAALVVAANAAGAASFAPVVTPTVSGTAGKNGWYTSNVTVSWSVYDPVSMITSTSSDCLTRTFSSDTSGRRLTCTATNVAGDQTSVSITIKIDKTSPQVAAPVADRLPEPSGWYTRPVSFSYRGSDATSGIESCSQVSYGGPDSETAGVVGTCHDRAGNIGAPLPFSFKYDATAPAFLGAAVKAGDRSALLRWQAAPDSMWVEIARSTGAAGAAPTVVFRGSDSDYTDRRLKLGATYRYVLTSYDAAGNSASTTLAHRVAALYAPRYAERVSLPPLLAWSKRARARYYNVQLFRGPRKVLSAWPSRPRLQLRPRWIYDGRRFRLTPARYRWYVWPGFGSRAEARYGKLLGRSSFVVLPHSSATAGKRVTD